MYNQKLESMKLKQEFILKYGMELFMIEVTHKHRSSDDLTQLKISIERAYTYFNTLRETYSSDLFLDLYIKTNYLD